jgi:predicted CopG family antitoxin
MFPEYEEKKVRLDATIRVSRETKKKLDSIKVHPRQSYDEVIRKLIELYEQFKR